MPTINKPSTIYDVARAAGVSIKTVSRVANQQAHVADGTRARVQEVIGALGYRANEHARNMALRAGKADLRAGRGEV